MIGGRLPSEGRGHVALIPFTNYPAVRHQCCHSWAPRYYRDCRCSQGLHILIHHTEIHCAGETTTIAECSERLDFRQRGALMHRDVIGLVALNLVLRVIDAASMSVTFVLHIFCVHLNDFALHVADLRVPTHVVST